MSACPSCGDQLTPDRYNYIDFESEQGPSGMGQPFPDYIEVTMFENYICYNCGSKIRLAKSKAKYKDPEILEIKSTVGSE